MKNISIIARILFAFPFALMGLNHFLMTNLFLGMMSSFIPGGAFTILLTGALLIIASIFIIINKFVQTACYWLAGMLLMFIISIHIPGLIDTDMALNINEWSMHMIGLLKDTALMGGAIMIALYSKTLKEDNVENS